MVSAGAGLCSGRLPLRPPPTSPTVKSSPAASSTAAMAIGQNSRADRRGQNDGNGRPPSLFRRQSSRSLSPAQEAMATASSPRRVQGGA